MGRTKEPRRNDSAAGRDEVARFEAFYDFAFPRVYRFAQDRTESEAQAQAFCRLVMVRALTSLGGLGAFDHGGHRDPAELAFWLFDLTRKVAAQVAASPELLEESLASLEPAVDAAELERSSLSSSGSEPAPRR